LHCYVNAAGNTVNYNIGLEYRPERYILGSRLVSLTVSYLQYHWKMASFGCHLLPVILALDNKTTEDKTIGAYHLAQKSK